ncbi:hypothetical protein N8I84_28910 [Streptomyces cynarae]|uniref:Uncharacterized protein n=1 Tax=Streptomyces cynarae TaxID=2981134 RepID=A0ABY6E6J8_9ACTN|nr:hypothetical protein [Streptomyces cynarae]UXY22267.1 hypothetical protein N8I84_28910 [Streptomyces cynarae]
MSDLPGKSPASYAAIDSGESVAFRFQAQPEFHEVPLGIGIDEDALDEQMRSFARDYWGNREDWEPLRRMFAAVHTANAQQLASQGVVYYALGVFPIGGTADGAVPPERISRCTLLVSTRELDNSNPVVSAAGIAEALAHSNPDGEVQPVRIPAGPAVISIGASRAVWSLPDGGEQERFLVRIELWVPFPADNRLLLFCLSTSDVHDLHRYQAILADIADTISFGGVKRDSDVMATSAHDIGATFG